jgi:membrane fusion protein, heavy metal efflux system
VKMKCPTDQGARPTPCIGATQLILACLFLMLVLLTGCSGKVEADPRAEAPPPATVEREADASLVKVDHPEKFPLATAEAFSAVPQLRVTGVVSPDVSRNVPVISLASGRVVEVNARLGDEVKKGQVLLKVQSSDIASAFSDYRKAVASEALTRRQLERAQTLYDHGAVPKKDLEVAEDAETKAKVDVETTEQRLKLLGYDANHPNGIVDIVAPVSGVIVEQNVTTAGGVKSLDNSPNLFTIADLSRIWIVCDVFENDLASVRVGEYADIRLNAYPDRLMKGRISNIGPILDPNLRSAKVRLEVQNPGILRVGMFVTATFHGQQQQLRAKAPATAVLHLHDRDWVYVPAENSQFRRVEVVAGNMLPENMQEIISGIKPGTKVAANALVLQNTVEQ